MIDSVIFYIVGFACVSAVAYFYSILMVSVFFVWRFELKAQERTGCKAPKAMYWWHPWFHMHKVIGYAHADVGKRPYAMRLYFDKEDMNLFQKLYKSVPEARVTRVVLKLMRYLFLFNLVGITLMIVLAAVRWDLFFGESSRF